jgi:PST family polysaccharide transporter
LDIRGKAVRGVAWMTAQRGATQVISFIVFTLLSRLIEPEAFGLITMAMVFIAFLDLFLDQGFSSAIVQRVEVEREHLDTSFWATVLIGILFSIVGFFGSSVIASIFQEPQVAPLVGWLSLGVFMSSLSKTQLAILRRELAFGTLAVRVFIAEGVGGIIGVFMAFQGFGVWSLVGRNLSRDFVAMIILWTVSGWRPRLNFSTSHFLDLFPVGMNFLGISVVSFLNRFFDRFLLGIFLDAQTLGFYVVGARLIELTSMLFLQTIQGVSFAVFSRLQHEMDRMRNFFYETSRYTSILAVPAFLGISFVASEIIEVFFGSKWLPSIPILRILALVGIAQVIHFLSWSLLVASGKVSWRLGLSILSTCVNTLAVILVAEKGSVAIASAVVFSTYLFIPITLWAVRRLVKVDLWQYGKHVASAFVGSLGMILVLVGLRFIIGDIGSAIVRLVVYVLCAALTYVLILRRIHRDFLTRMIELGRSLIPQR